MANCSQSKDNHTNYDLLKRIRETNNIHVRLNSDNRLGKWKVTDMVEAEKLALFPLVKESNCKLLWREVLSSCAERFQLDLCISIQIGRVGER